MHKTLVHLSGNVVCREDWKVWTANCGRGVSHHSGPHCATKALKLVETLKHAEDHATKSVKLNGKGWCQQLSSGAKVLQTVRSHMLASQALVSVPGPALQRSNILRHLATSIAN